MRKKTQIYRLCWLEEIVLTRRLGHRNVLKMLIIQYVT